MPRKAILLLASTLLAMPPLAGASSSCPGGRFLVQGAPLLAGQAGPAPDAIVMTPSFVSIASGCGPASVRSRATRKGTTVHATFVGCRDGRKKVLRARLDPTCKTLAGTLASRGMAKRRFVARLSTCGDGVLDADNGEQCDDGNQVGGDRCEANCTLPPVTTTTTSSTTTTTLHFDPPPPHPDPLPPDYPPPPDFDAPPPPIPG